MSKIVTKEGLQRFLSNILNITNLKADKTSIPDWAEIKDVTTSVGTVYHSYWSIAPTSSNQVYGIAIHPTTGQLYRIYNDKGTYTAQNLYQDRVDYYSGFEPYCPSGSYMMAGAAITKNRPVFQGEDGKFYPLTNTTVAVSFDTKIVYVTIGTSSGGTINNTNGRMKIYVGTSNLFSGLTAPTIAKNDIIYAQFSENNGKIYSDATVVKSSEMVSGKYYYRLGHAWSESNVFLDSYGTMRLV